MREKINFTKVSESNTFEILSESNKIGTAEFVEFNKKLKTTTIRLKVEKGTDNTTLTEILTKMYKKFINTGDIYKFNVICDETINIAPLTRMGFTLEGILFNNDNQGIKSKDEYIFGLDSQTINSSLNSSSIVLKGKRVALKLAMPKDAEKFLEYYKDNSEFLEEAEPSKDRNFFTLDYQSEDLKYRYSLYLKGQAILFGVYIEDKLIGKIRISDITYGALKSCKIGYALHKDYVNQGLMKESIDLCKEFAFDELGMHRVEATTVLDNFPSQRVLEKCGFKKCGLIESYLYINKKWMDCYLFSLSRN